MFGGRRFDGSCNDRRKRVPLELDRARVVPPQPYWIDFGRRDALPGSALQASVKAAANAGG